jgi:elongation factor G
MSSYTTADIRNIALVGHASAGKTQLAEAILHTCGVTNRLGNVADGTSTLDHTDEEKERGCSVESHVCHVSHRGKTVNIVDTPGSMAFVGPAIAGLMGAETAVCVISASSGIEVNARRMMDTAREYGLGRAVVINKIQAENVDLAALVGQIQEVFGTECQPINLPAGGGTSVIDCFTNESGDADVGDVAAAHEAVVEGIVASDDAMMEKYLGGELDMAELGDAVGKAIAGGDFVPIMFTDARAEVGIGELLDVVTQCMPSPVDGKQRMQTRGSGDDAKSTPVAPDPSAQVIGQVFKIVNDTRTNIKYSVIRVLSGTIKGDTMLISGDDKRGQRAGQLHKMQGSDHGDVDTGIAGDIIAAAKLDLKVGDVVHTGEIGTIEQPQFPVPMLALAIEPKSRGDADKVNAALARFTDEDPCFVAERDPTTHELLIKGMQDLQLLSILSRMKAAFKLEVTTRPPRIPYKETITKTAKEVDYTHKKQTGGAGQYARVIITMEPMGDAEEDKDKDYEFVDQIFGGAIDQVFRPSVDKGVQSQMTEGVIAGYPVTGVRVRLVDGKTHPVDSKDIAFQIAGKEAFKKAMAMCHPVLLEPIVNIEVTVPTQYVGDVQGDLASRRGRPQGQDMLPGGMAVIKAQVPLAEVSDFSSRLSGLSQGQGSYSMTLSHYEQVPANVQAQIVEAAHKAKEEAAK